MRSSVNTTVDAVSTRPDSAKESHRCCRQDVQPQRARLPTGFLGRRADEKDNLTIIFQLVERRLEVTVAFVERVRERSPEQFSRSHV